MNAAKRARKHPKSEQFPPPIELHRRYLEEHNALALEVVVLTNELSRLVEQMRVMFTRPKNGHKHK